MRRLALLVALSCGLAWAADPVRLIFDTDIGNDVDDALALAMIHRLASLGEARLLAVTITKDCRSAAPYIDLVDTFYGRPDIPIGVVPVGNPPGQDTPMIEGPVDSGFYPHRLKDQQSALDAVTVLRRVLRAEPDHSVVIVQVGFSSNLARLLRTDHSLIQRKVKLLVVMAGAFPTGKKEFNVYSDVSAAKHLFAEWPTPIVASGFEVGLSILYPATSIDHDFNYVDHHPIADAYRRYKKMPYDRPTWDLTAALYAIRPEAGYFGLSAPGKITVDDDAITHFIESPGGKHRYLTATTGQRQKALAAMIELASAPPDHR